MNDRLIRQLQEEDLFPQASKADIEQREKSIDYSFKFPLIKSFALSQFKDLNNEDFNTAVRYMNKAGMATSREGLQAIEETLYHLTMMFDEALSDIEYPPVEE